MLLGEKIFFFLDLSPNIFAEPSWLGAPFVFYLCSIPLPSPLLPPHHSPWPSVSQVAFQNCKVPWSCKGSEKWRQHHPRLTFVSSIHVFGVFSFPLPVFSFHCLQSPVQIPVHTVQAQELKLTGCLEPQFLHQENGGNDRWGTGFGKCLVHSNESVIVVIITLIFTACFHAACNSWPPFG